MPPLRSIASRRTPEVGVGVGNSSILPVFASTRPSLCPSSSAKYTAFSGRDVIIPYAFALGVGTGYSVILPVAALLGEPDRAVGALDRRVRAGARARHRILREAFRLRVEGRDLVAALLRDIQPAVGSPGD